MPTVVAMPKLGMTMQQGTVVEWPVPIGEPVEHGQIVLVIESEKAEIEIEATGSGTLRHIYIEPEQTVPCGTLLAVLTDETDEPFDAQAFKARYDAERDDSPASVEKKPVPRPAAPSRAPAATAGQSPVTPAARKLAKRLALDPGEVTGSGPGGRVTREDVENHALRRNSLVTVAQGVALDVPAAGGGDPVLLLPGFGTDVSVFARQIPPLAEKFAVRAVNPRGVALSDAPETAMYEVATLASDVAALIDAPTHLVGTSLGAAIALELALTHPEKVRSLSLIAPLVTVTGRLAAVSQAWCDLAATASADELAATLLPWFFSEATLGDAAARGRIARGLAATLAQAQPAALARTRAGMLAWSGTREADLARIDTPTLVVVAAEDLLVPNGTAVAAAIPGARCSMIEGAGHAVCLEAAEAVNAALLRHLA